MSQTKSTKQTKQAKAQIVEEVEEVDSSDNFSHVSIDDFDLSKIVIQPIDEKFCEKSTQYMTFPKYSYTDIEKDASKVMITTESIKMSKGGIPSLDGEYRKTDADCEYFWLYRDPAQPTSNALFDKLKELDEHYAPLVGNNAKSQLFFTTGKDKTKKYFSDLEYIPIVRESAGGESKDGETKYEPTERIKVKFSTKYDPTQSKEEPKQIDTVLFLKNSSGEFKDDPESYSSVEDFRKSLRWNCEARYVLNINKFWIAKTAKNKRRDCGFGIVCEQIYITKENSLGGAKSQADRFKKNIFANSSSKPAPVVLNTSSKIIDSPSEPTETSESESDSESEEEVAVPVAPPTKVEVKSKTQTKPQVVSESEESESESEEEPEPEPEPPKKTKAKTVSSKK